MVKVKNSHLLVFILIIISLIAWYLNSKSPPPVHINVPHQRPVHHTINRTVHHRTRPSWIAYPGFINLGGHHGHHRNSGGNGNGGGNGNLPLTIPPNPGPLTIPPNPSPLTIPPNPGSFTL